MKYPSDVRKKMSPWFPLIATTASFVPFGYTKSPSIRVTATSLPFTASRGAEWPAWRPGHMFGMDHVPPAALRPATE